MLKSPSTHRSSQGSPSFHHYGTSPPRSAPLLRRTSSAKFPSSSSSPQPQPRSQAKKWIGVDASTQWSPIAGQDTKMQDPPSMSTSAKTQSENIRPPTAPINYSSQPSMSRQTDTDPTPLAKAESQAGSPSVKRRQPLQRNESVSSVVERSQSTAVKKPKSGHKPVIVLPEHYVDCEVEDMVILISSMISELIHTNDALPLHDGKLTRFHSRTSPGISVLDYLSRLAKHATLTTPLLLAMVYYIDRLCLMYPAFRITTLTIHRFLITAATVASKGLSDSFWNNTTYARVGGIKKSELGVLELEFLDRVDWKIIPNPESLINYYTALVKRNDGYEFEGDVSSKEEEEEEDDDSESPGGETKSAQPKGAAVSIKVESEEGQPSALKDSKSDALFKVMAGKSKDEPKR